VKHTPDNLTQKSNTDHLGSFRGPKDRLLEHCGAVSARSAFERPPADVRDPEAADFDCLSACPDSFPPHYCEARPNQHAELCKRKSAGEHDRLGDAVHTGTGEQGKSAALLSTKVRRHRRHVSGGPSRRCSVGLLAHERPGSRLRPRPPSGLTADQWGRGRVRLPSGGPTLQANAGHSDAFLWPKKPLIGLVGGRGNVLQGRRTVCILTDCVGKPTDKKTSRCFAMATDVHPRSSGNGDRS
jgi:hypothetical protein